MNSYWVARGLLGLSLFGVGVPPALAGDSLYGKVTAVRTGDVVIFDYGHGQYIVRLAGIDVPTQGPIAKKARDFVADRVLDKKARIRFEYRAKSGEMVSRLFTDDPVIGIRDIGLELVRAGLARKQPKFDYKYGELSAAEIEARKLSRGLWARP